MPQTINLNIIPDNSRPIAHVSQYDVGRTLKFKLFEGSASYSVVSGSTVKLQGTKPSGFGFSLSCTFSGNEVTAVTNAEMTDEWGDFPVELRITKNSDILGTANLILSVERSPHPDGTTDGESSEVIPELTQLVERIEAAADSIHDLNVVANTLEPGQAATATYNGTTNTITFGIPRGHDIEVSDSDSDGNIVMTFV